MLIAILKSFFVKKEEVENILSSTAILASGTMISVLMWLFLITILVKVFNSAFKNTEQQDSTDYIKNKIIQNQSKRK